MLDPIGRTSPELPLEKTSEQSVGLVKQVAQTLVRSFSITQHLYTLEDPELRSRIRSATYLIKNAGLRPKYVAGNFNKFSLNRRSLGELVDMYIP